jgi:tetratricopeptide (TPR) repeat protein
MATVGVVFAGCATNDKDNEAFTPVDAEIKRRIAEANARPNDAQAAYSLGNAYFDASRYPEARDAYQRAIQLDPAAADAYTNLGLTQRVLGDNEAAIDNYRTALTIAPDDEVTLQNLVSVLQADGRVAETVAPLARLTELRPEDTAFLTEYALTFEALGRFDEAAQVYTRVILKRPDDLQVHYALGRCYFELDRWEDAIGAWQSVVTFDPNFGEAHSGLAAAYFERKDYDRAWLSVRECQRLGAYIDPELVLRLQDATGKLGPE